MKIFYQQLDLRDKEVRDRLFDDLKQETHDDVAQRYLEDLQAAFDEAEESLNYYERRDEDTV